MQKSCSSSPQPHASHLPMRIINQDAESLNLRTGERQKVRIFAKSLYCHDNLLFASEQKADLRYGLDIAQAQKDVGAKEVVRFARNLHSLFG
jgi:hypothetical protein